MKIISAGGYWSIGDDYTNDEWWSPGSSYIHAKSRTLEIPENGWSYYFKTWLKDDSLTVEKIDE